MKSSGSTRVVSPGTYAASFLPRCEAYGSCSNIKHGNQQVKLAAFFKRASLHPEYFVPLFTPILRITPIIGATQKPNQPIIYLGMEKKFVKNTMR